MFVIHCPRCGFGQEIDFEAKLWVCPQCGTRVTKVKAIVVAIKNMDCWLSEEQAQFIVGKAAAIVHSMVNQLGQGKKLQVGG